MYLYISENPLLLYEDGSVEVGLRYAFLLKYVKPDLLRLVYNALLDRA